MLILDTQYPPFGCPFCGVHVAKPHAKKQRTCGKFACSEKQKKATAKAKAEERRALAEAKEQAIP